MIYVNDPFIKKVALIIKILVFTEITQEESNFDNIK